MSTVAASLDILASTPRINGWIVDRLRPWLGQRVLEVGSGIGNLTRLILDRELVVATDVMPEFVERLRGAFARTTNVVVESLDLERIPVEHVRQHRIDSVLCVNVLEHVRDDARALADLFACLPAGGRLVIYVPALPALYGSLDRGLDHHRRYSRAELVGRLEGAGWRLEHLSYMNLFGIPGWFLNSRILKRKLLPVKQIELYDRLVPLLRLEERVRLPIGMSLVAVGVKDA